jgi:hypothetical protein
MDKQSTRKRPPRVALTAEQVAQLLAFKKHKEIASINRFKKTTTFKCLNIFFVIAFGIYVELIVCYVGPCNYTIYEVKEVNAKYNGVLNSKYESQIGTLSIVDTQNKLTTLVIDDFIDLPESGSQFRIGKDYIYQKEVKAEIQGYNSSYRIQRFSPVLFLSSFICLLTVILFVYNLNQNPYSLRAISLINAIVLLAFIGI